MIASMYLFHVSNPEEVSEGGKPHLVEKGPYVFTEQHYKTNISWNNNGTVTYKQIRSWHFQPQLSKGSLEDKVTILNPVAGSVGAMIEENIDSDILRTLIDSLLKTIDEELFITKSVR